MDFALKVANAPNFVTGDNKLSRAAAFLFAFSVLHAFPNILLLFPGGLGNYQRYADQARRLWLLPAFEVYLALSLIVHIFLAGRVALTKPVGWLSVTGAVLLVFLAKHLLDFRFGGSLDRLAESLPDIVQSQRIFYSIGVTSATVHVFKAIRPAWLFSLGFRGNEITILVRLGRILTVITVLLYSIPLVVL